MLLDGVIAKQSTPCTILELIQVSGQELEQQARKAGLYPLENYK
jgi:hypothetical protein